MTRPTVTYTAKERCLVGTLREPGERFRWPRFAVCPRYLDETPQGENGGNAAADAPAPCAPDTPDGTGDSPGDVAGDSTGDARRVSRQARPLPPKDRAMPADLARVN